MKRLIMQAQNNYDVIIIGSGVGGSILAAHIAEKGVNPRNGERLRIAMLEAGPYWKGEPRPGYGVPLRRQAITNVFSDDASERMWPWGMVKMVGGSTMHYGASVYLPYSVDYKHWVDEGTDWTEEACRDAAAEVEKMFNIHTEPDEMLSKGCLMFRETAKALGREVHPAQVARRNCLYCGFCEGGYFCRYDSKMNAMTTYIPLAEKRGVEIIPNAPVERVIIEKKGARPVATGVVFQQAGKSVELRASKIIVSGGVIGTPRLLFMSGYGPKDDLGGKLVVENSNIGKHLDIHAAIIVQAYFDEPIKDGSRGAAPSAEAIPIDDDSIDTVVTTWTLCSGSFISANGVTEPGATPSVAINSSPEPKEKRGAPICLDSPFRSRRKLWRSTTSQSPSFLSLRKRFLVCPPCWLALTTSASSTVKTGTCS